MGNGILFLKVILQNGSEAQGRLQPNQIIIFVSDSIYFYVYGERQGDSDYLPISLGDNVLDIGVFSGPSPDSSPPKVLPNAGSIVVIVSSMTTMIPPQKIRIGRQTILPPERQQLRRRT